MKTRSVEPPDVSGTVYTWQNLRREDMARELLTRILDEGPDYGFDRMGHDEPLRQRFDFEKAVKLWQKDISTTSDLTYGELILERTIPPHTGFMMGWQKKPAGLWLNGISIWARGAYFEDQGHTESFLALLRDLFLLLGAGYGVAYHSREWEEKGWTDQILADGRRARTTIPLKAQHGLVDVYWANFFGPPYARLFGEDRIKECPGAEVRQIGPESYLILMAPSPFDWSLQEVQKKADQVKGFLDRNAFLDRAIPNHKPTGPEWNPE